MLFQTLSGTGLPTAPGCVLPPLPLQALNLGSSHKLPLPVTTDFYFKTLETALVFHLSSLSPLEIKNTSSWDQKKTGSSKVSLESHSMSHGKTTLCSGRWFILIGLG